MDALYVDGQPIALHWPDFAGSVGQEFYLTEVQAPHEHQLHLTDIVADGLRVGHGLGVDDLKPLLRQFASGTYQLLLEDIERSWSFEEWRGATPAHFGWYYPSDDGWREKVTLLPTQNEALIDTARVEQWSRLIKGGRRPFAITARIGDSAHEYVLDGHHKLRAYESVSHDALSRRRKPINPWRLCICTPPGSRLTQGDWPLEAQRMPRPWRKLPGRG